MQNDKTENAMRNLLYGILQKSIFKSWNAFCDQNSDNPFLHFGTEYLGLGSLLLLFCRC